MGYPEQRDAILVHAKAAALAVSSTWTDVAIGMPWPTQRCIRIFYGGEVTPVRFPDPRVLNGQLVAESVILAAFWPLPTGSTANFKNIDDDMYALKHELRTRILGDSQLGGQSVDLEMGFAEPDIVVLANVRYAVLEVHFTTDYTEYPLAP